MLINDMNRIERESSYIQSVKRYCILNDGLHNIGIGCSLNKKSTRCYSLLSQSNRMYPISKVFAFCRRKIKHLCDFVYFLEDFSIDMR